MAGKRKGKSPSGSAATTSKRTKKAEKEQVITEPKIEEVEEEVFELENSEIGFEEVEGNSEDTTSSPAGGSSRSGSARKQPVRKVEPKSEEEESRFIGEPVPEDEARQRWPHRYFGNKKAIDAISEALKGTEEANLTTQARRHFTQAEVDGKITFNIGDDGYVMAGEGEDSYICRIVEMFEATDGSPYFTAQWFYRAKDTVIQACSKLIDDKRVFLSKIKDDNPLDCLLKKLRIIRLPLNVDTATKTAAVSDCDYYYDMHYLVPFSSFVTLPPDNAGEGESESTISSESDVIGTVNEGCEVEEKKMSETTLLDLYSGCGAMSTGLCLGANMSGVNLVTKWAVDLNPHACESLKLNHPETEVRNESAEDFLMLLKEWEQLCLQHSLIVSGYSQNQCVNPVSHKEEEEEEDEEDEDDGGNDDAEVFEVEKVLSICYGDPKGIKNRGLYLKIRWKGYGPEEDTWEPIDGLSDCADKIKEFVVNGYKSKILPLPGQVDVVCGGPPCQGISGFNRFRNTKDPLSDEKNKQMLVYMDVVEYLKPRIVLMENVVDIVKFAKGYLGRYALARLVGLNYQARIGLMAAGAYGLPQFRMRMFMWGARSTEKLPQYPLPTHDVVVRGNSPVEFESNTVAYDDRSVVELEKKLYLEDAISDLPSVENNEARDEMPYLEEPKTEFQKFIRLRRDEMPGFTALGSKPSPHLLYDHRPLKLNDDDYQRVCHIPKRKGANFRDLAGVKVGPNRIVEWDPDVERVYLSSGKPLVPDYAMSFIDGKSSKPFGRLWWDETVPTVVTRAEPHNQVILHPSQDRVLSIRENARLQGFPDYYKLLGPIKERYIQVGNAVAVPVARALGYSLGLAYTGSSSGEDPLLILPKKFPFIVGDRLSPSVDDKDH